MKYYELYNSDNELVHEHKSLQKLIDRERKDLEQSKYDDGVYETGEEYYTVKLVDWDADKVLSVKDITIDWDSTCDFPSAADMKADYLARVL